MNEQWGEKEMSSLIHVVNNQWKRKVIILKAVTRKKMYMRNENKMKIITEMRAMDCFTWY